MTHTEVTQHQVRAITLGPVTKLPSGAYTATLFVDTKDGHTLEVVLFSEFSSALDSVVLPGRGAE
jgi:hypothetical protein